MTKSDWILVVEDDPLIAMDLEDELVDRGFDVKRAGTVAAALKHLETGSPSVAILDMHLKAETTFPLAAELGNRGVPFFFLSGNDATALPASLRSSRIVTKPARIERVVEEVRALTKR